jgi:hypothetical protein
MRKPLISAFLVVIMFTISAKLVAHHGSAASYSMEASKLVTMTGTVTYLGWANPHVFILYDVTDDKGNVTHWSAETHPIYVLHKAGWTARTLKPGDQIKITVFPSKAGTPVGLLAKISMDGKVLLDDQQNRLRQNTPNE